MQLKKCVKRCRQKLTEESNLSNAIRRQNLRSTERSGITEPTLIQSHTDNNDFTPSAPLLPAQNSPQCYENYAFQIPTAPQINRQSSTSSVPESLPPTYSEAGQISRPPTPPPNYSALFNWMYQ